MSYERAGITQQNRLIRAQMVCDCLSELIRIPEATARRSYQWNGGFKMQSGWKEPDVTINYETGVITRKPK